MPRGKCPRYVLIGPHLSSVVDEVFFERIRHPFGHEGRCQPTLVAAFVLLLQRGVQI